MNFTMLHGAGNDFIVVDAREHTRDWTKLAIALCDRHMASFRIIPDTTEMLLSGMSVETLSALPPFARTRIC